ncbi:glycosyltransferase family 32 protein [Roseateles amylovorans]|uniref:Capsular polysaccharide synthesis protein n=1 Tax=Roseateles amylovorans TaxID=2978473 RepID=A0ABY6B3Y3_9BURK|nr:capsular polysaccharide synthesis protein [Roseateles amylovorans]UXH79899.1 capsular polysaccharide synthesis protein [Roseateles amylovorans]
MRTSIIHFQLWLMRPFRDWIRHLLLRARPTTHPIIHTRRHPTSDVVAPTAPTTRVPAIIWSYWHDTELPPIVRGCFRSWQRHAPDHVIHLLSRDTLTRFIPEEQLPEGFDRWPPYRQSDWLRVALVGQHGGIWMDASILLTRPPDWLPALVDRHHGGFAGFHLQRSAPRLKGGLPFLENWCFAAPPGDPFVLAWKAELSHAMRLGEVVYLAGLGPHQALILEHLDNPIYLVMHAAARVVLLRDGPFDMTLLPAEDSAYFLLNHSGWRRSRLLLALLGWAERGDTAMVKLRGTDRARLTRQLQRTAPMAQSIVATELLCDITRLDSPLR